jgi:hypothetical protein
LSDTRSKLKEYAQLAIISGRLSEMHIQNLKLYPMIFFNGVHAVRIQYDLTHKKTAEDEPVLNPNIVSFYLDLEGDQNAQIDKRFAALETAVRDLLWSDITVEIYFNDKIVFKSNKNGK